MSFALPIALDRISDPKLLLVLQIYTLWIRNNDRGLGNTKSLPPREHNEQQTIGKVCEKGECNRFVESLKKIQTLNFPYGNHDKYTFKRSKTSLKVPSKISEVGFILEHVIGLTLLDANKNLKFHQVLLKKGKKKKLKLGHVSPTHSQSYRNPVPYKASR